LLLLLLLLWLWVFDADVAMAATVIAGGNRKTRNHAGTPRTDTHRTTTLAGGRAPSSNTGAMTEGSSKLSCFPRAIQSRSRTTLVLLFLWLTLR